MKHYKSKDTSIQGAMVDQYKSCKSSSERPDYILFDEQKVKTAHWIDVPNYFDIKLEFLSKADAEQGADIKVDSGYLVLADDSHVSLLRTWHDPKYDPCVEYFGYSKTGKVLVYNVYTVERNGEIFEEKWTGNAGMIVEQQGVDEWVLKCSSSMYNPPNFASIVFKVSVHEHERPGR